MKALNQAEAALLRLRSHLAIHQRELSIAEKVGRSVESIYKEIQTLERKVKSAESLISQVRRVQK
ncbi:hypothetical protein BH11ARM1_BH11ARM1_15600 [soil metagenome]